MDVIISEFLHSKGFKMNSKFWALWRATKKAMRRKSKEPYRCPKCNKLIFASPFIWFLNLYFDLPMCCEGQLPKDVVASPLDIYRSS